MSDELTIVRMKNVRKCYRSGKLESQILHGIDLEVRCGEFCAIVGTSGSGKTTVLNIIGGLDRDYTGEVQVAGAELGRLSDASVSRLRNEKVGFVFQHFNLLEHLSCVENVAMPAIFSRRAAADTRARAAAALERVGLGARADDLPQNLSGGQKQRVAIARALFNQPPLLLCDEPTGNLDTRTGGQIIDLFTELNRQDGISLIIVTHESRVSSAAHRVIRLEDGRISADEEAIGASAQAAREAASEGP